MKRFGKSSARLYDLFSGFGPEASFRRKTVALCGAKAGERILELGCGTARFSETLLRTHPGAFDLTGLDLSIHMLGRAVKNCAGLEINFVTADAGSLPFVDQSFERIVAVLTFHEMPSALRTAALAECRRVLRPGGFLVAVDFRKPDSLLLRLLHRCMFFEGFTLQQMLATGLDKEMEENGFTISGRRKLGLGLMELVQAQK
jgi:ubiquinone/menaquinone biosynthesis C-methylase UbiE